MSGRRIAFFAFNGEFMCFIHVLLNALDMKEKGVDIRVILEGSATKLVPELAALGNPMHDLYQRVKAQGLIDGVCRACATKMGVVEAVEKEGLPFLADMSGHPSISRYMDQGYEVQIF